MRNSTITNMSLKEKVFEILKDGQPHRSDEITFKLFGTDDTSRIGLFNLHARVTDLRKDGCSIPPAWHDKENSKLCWYQLILKKIPIEPVQNTLFKLRQITD